jgi:hypothetical protein
MRRSGRYFGGGTVGIPPIVGLYSVAHPIHNRQFVKAMKMFRLFGLFYRNGVILTWNLAP